MGGRENTARSAALRLALVVLAAPVGFVVSALVVHATQGADGAASSGTAAVESSGHFATGLPTGGALTAPRRTPGAPSSSAPSPSSDALAAEAAVRAAMDSCRLSNLRQEALLKSADVALAQFQKHIDAMNLLVSGKISLPVAQTFWEQTRVGAVDNDAVFIAADKAFTATSTGCAALPPTVAAAAPASSVAAVSRCAAALTAGSTAAAKARIAVATWEHHIHDMEMLRMGQMTPAQMTVAWNASWKTGQAQLQAYTAATKAADRTQCTLT